MKIKIGFFGIMMLLSLLLSNPSLSVPALLAAAIHELGHILAAKRMNIRLKELKLGIFGAGLLPQCASLSYGQEILLCLAGPLANGATVFLLHVLGLASTSSFCSVLCFASIALGGLNLLPVRDFDGGRMLGACLSLWFSPSVSERILTVLSFLLVWLLWGLSLYFLLRTSASLSLFVFSAALFSKLFLLPFSKPLENATGQKQDKSKD